MDNKNKNNNSKIIIYIIIFIVIVILIIAFLGIGLSGSYFILSGDNTDLEAGPPVTITAVTSSWANNTFTFDVTGTGFLLTSTYSIDGHTGPITYISDTKCQVIQIIKNSKTLSGTLIIYNGSTESNGFAVIAQSTNTTTNAPTITSVTSSWANNTFTFQVTGTGFLSTSTYSISGHNGLITYQTATTCNVIQLINNSKSISGNLIIYNGSSPSNAWAIDVTSTTTTLNVPSITAVTSSWVDNTFTFNVTGTGFLSTSTYTVDGYNGLITYQTATTCQVIQLINNSKQLNGNLIIYNESSSSNAWPVNATSTTTTENPPTITAVLSSWTNNTFTFYVTGTNFATTSTYSIDGHNGLITYQSTTTCQVIQIIKNYKYLSGNLIIYNGSSPSNSWPVSVTSTTTTLNAPTITLVTYTWSDNTCTFNVTGTGFTSASTYSIDGHFGTITNPTATTCQVIQLVKNSNTISGNLIIYNGSSGSNPYPIKAISTGGSS